MGKTLDQIAIDALALPEDDRLALGERLLHSVPENAAVAEAWDAELARRVDDIKYGRVEGIPANEVEAELREIVS